MSSNGHLKAEKEGPLHGHLEENLRKGDETKMDMGGGHEDVNNKELGLFQMTALCVTGTMKVTELKT